MTKRGTVYLVGAGPGDPGLITVRAKRLIENADVIVYDRLIGDEILSMIPDGMKRIDVGKDAGNHPVPQGEIGEILLREAAEHKTIVRLKGGDPFVFGRGGEEAELLFDNGVPFEIVPGVTSSIAAPAYAGIPVTHRDFTSSLHIITGHGKNDTEVSIDYGALIRFGGTLVFMMSVATAPAIASGLITAGMDENTPAAIIENGTTAKQRNFTGTIKELPDIIRREGVKSPAVIVVGGVCALAQKLSWLSHRPLHGCRVLVTRPRDVARSFGESLRELGADVTYYPCIETQPLKFSLQLDGLDWAIFTSAAGVNAFFACLENAGYDARKLANISVAAVGDRTAAALKKYGICADFVPKIFDGKHLGAELTAAGHIKSGQNAALYRANIGGEDIVEILREAGVNLLDIPVYETVLTATEPDNLAGYDYITFTSASAVDGFAKANKRDGYLKIPAICIGEQTAVAASAAGFETIVADKADTGAMIEKLLEVWTCK
ncbi:MAG: uroporphyrinogen-III C-methyltransferase [Oscillospiraceae bacterium]|nr:uroporphyrinogen-III C-methyltransferase [Oscillospiraceae bacterium]